MNSRAQLKLDSNIFKGRDQFGGSLMRLAKNRRARPISTRDTMHVILKSKMATGKFSFGYRSNPTAIKRTLDRHCQKYGVKLVSYSNNFNHLHLHLKFPSRGVYLRFIRSLTATIAMLVTGAAKTRGLPKISGALRFWDARPFTRIVRGVRGFRAVENYIRINQLEALGLLPKRSRPK